MSRKKERKKERKSWNLRNSFKKKNNAEIWGSHLKERTKERKKERKKERNVLKHLQTDPRKTKRF